MKLQVVAGVMVIMMVAVLTGCGKGGQVPAAMPGVPVTTGKAVLKDMPVEITAVGTVEAIQSVTIIPRVNGQIKEIHFKEGQDVHKGDLLFTLDPAAYEKELAQTEAKLRKEQEQAIRDTKEAERYGKLAAIGALSNSDYEEKTTKAATQQAALADAQAAVDNARVKLEYCYIRAPIDGRAGAGLVKQGDVVAENSTKVLVINQLQPVHAKFSVPEKHLNQIRQNQAVQVMTVTAMASGQSKKAEGKLVFIDNAVDKATGTVMLKAEFPNSDIQLWPGQYVSAALTLTVITNAVVVPAQALQPGQDGTYIFVVKADETVEARKVTAGWSTAKETIITQGVTAGETVVTDGQLNLKDRVKVQVKEAK